MKKQDSFLNELSERISQENELRARKPADHEREENRKKMNPEKAYLAEKHLQTDSEEPDIEKLVKAARKYKKKLRPSVTVTEDAMRKARVCQEMEALVSGNFEGWDLRYNEPGYGSNGCAVEHGLFSVSVYRGKKFMGHRLIAPQASAEKALAEIANTFLLVMQRVKEVEQKS